MAQQTQTVNVAQTTQTPRTTPRTAAVDDCPDCSGELVQDGYETICDACGLVAADDRLDRGPEWRFADDPTGSGHNVKRCNGAPVDPTLHDGGMTTYIGRSAYGPTSQLSRLRKHQTRSRWETKRLKNRAYAFGEIRRMASVLDLGRPIQERACGLFTDAQDEDELQGRSLEAFASGALYAACRERGFARTPDEFVDAARCSDGEFRIGYAAINRAVGLEATPIEPADYIPRYASVTGVSMDVRETAMRYARRAAAEGASNGAKPSAFAMACLYHAARGTPEQFTQGDACEVCGASEPTIRAGRDALVDVLDDE